MEDEGGYSGESWKQQLTPGENGTSHWLSRTEFDGSLKRAAEGPRSEINGLKHERDMKPAVAYKMIGGGEG